jgi:hypothetical protein
MRRALTGVALGALAGALPALTAQPLAAQAGWAAPPAWGRFAAEATTPLGLNGPEPRALWPRFGARALGVTPPPATGLFATTGNPAGLAWEVERSWSRFSAGAVREHGEFRRPLDAAAEHGTELTVAGWSRLGEHGAGFGDVSFRSFTQEPGSYAAMYDPYRSNPFVTADSAQPDMFGQRVRLQGGGGWRLGWFGFGLAAGYEGDDSRTVASRRPRLLRAAVPAAAGGVAVQVPALQTRFGVHGRWRGGAETTTVWPRLGVVQIYPIQGYAEPVPRDYHPSPFRRRFEADARALGAGAAGVVLGASWAGGMERVRAREAQHAALSDDPPKDRWQATATAWSLALQRPFGPAHVTAHARGADWTSSATRADLEGTAFRARERTGSGGVELELAPLAGWSARGALLVSREERTRWDHVARLATQVLAWAPAAALEVAHALDSDWQIAADFAVARYSATARLPSLELRDALYRTLIGPELAVYATPAAARSLGATLSWQATLEAALWVRASHARLTPRGEPAAGVSAESRTAWRLDVGATLAQRPRTSAP